MISVDSHYTFSLYKYKRSNTPIRDFYVNEGGIAFIPLDGGVYLPKDSIWFIPPKKDRYIISFNANPKDTAVFLLTRDSVSSNILYLRAHADEKFKTVKLISFDPGMFNLLYRNKKLYVWGYSKGKYKIGIVTSKKIAWIVNIKDKITAVEISKDDKILFSVDKLIFDALSKKTILVADSPIAGFCIQDNGNFLISNSIGLSTKIKGKTKLLVTGIKGPIKKNGNKIYLVSDEYPILLEITEP